MRILHVITALPSAGAEMMLLKLLSFTKEDFTHAVISLKDEGTVGPRIKELGVSLFTLGLHPSVPDPFRAFSLGSITIKFRPEIIQGWMYHGNVMASLAGTFVRGRATVLWNVRQSLEDVTAYGRTTSAVIRLGARLSHRPAAIVYNSQTGAKQHEALGYDATKRVVIPNGFDCSVFRPDAEARRSVCAELSVPEESILIGLIARYHPMKDQANFLKAAAQLLRAYPSVRFMMVGKGVCKQQPALSKLIDDLQLKGALFLLGERHDTARLNAALDIACSASAWGEGFSNSIGEAMACGVPCVVTDVGDSSYIVGDTGLVAPPKNPEELACAMIRLIEAGAARRRQFGEAARRRIETEFSMPEIARRYQDLYREHAPSAEN